MMVGLEFLKQKQIMQIMTRAEGYIYQKIF